MKTLIAVCLLACSMSCFAQTNTTFRPTEEQLKKVQADQKYRAEIQKQADAALAATRQAARPTINTNLWYPGLGLDIQIMERSHPGFSTNFSPAQRALTNRADRNIGSKAWAPPKR